MLEWRVSGRGQWSVVSGDRQRRGPSATWWDFPSLALSALLVSTSTEILNLSACHCSDSPPTPEPIFVKIKSVHPKLIIKAVKAATNQSLKLSLLNIKEGLSRGRRGCLYRGPPTLPTTTGRIMRPPSKHGLERKFKPWRKGKSIRKSADGRTLKRPTNASLRNQLRGQKRLLAKLQQKNGPGDGNNPAGIPDIKERISQLERDIDAYETREREKKNASK